METRPVHSVPYASFFGDTSGDSAVTRPLHIVIYTLIPAGHAHQPIARPPLVALRNRARRWIELALWRYFGVWRAHYSTFKDAMHTNRGDVAVGMGVKRQLIEAFGGRHIKFTEIPWCALDDVFSLGTPVDLVVIAGGGYLFADEAGRLPPRFARDVEILSRLECPVAAISIGLNNLIAEGARETFRFHPDSRANVRQFLARVALVSVRDENTQRALAAESFRAVPVIIDPGFVLAPEALVGQPPPIEADGCLNIGLNIAFHGAHTTESTRRVLPIFVRVLNRLQSEMECRFTYFVHSDGERGIAEALRIAGIRLTVMQDSVENMLRAYRRMDVHMCQMLHSAIFAMSVGTPTLNLAYDIKSAGYYSLFGLDHLCLDMAASGEERIYTALTTLVAQRHNVTATIRDRGKELVQESREFYASVAALLEQEDAAATPWQRGEDRDAVAAHG